MNRIKTWLCGCTGRMGNELIAELLANTDRFELIGGFGKDFVGFFDGKSLVEDPKRDVKRVFNEVDLIIDFSSVDGNEYLFNHIERFESRRFSILIATTGLSDSSIKRWESLGVKNELSILFAPNTSLGILLTLKAALMISGIMSKRDFDIELVEAHHRNKEDSPGGTAKYLAQTIAKQDNLKCTFSRSGKRLKDELGVFAIRGGSVFGEHTIHFLGDYEEIALTHKALSRRLFAKGAFVLGKWLISKNSGIYTLMDIKIEDIIE